jgi:hypothetical protein
MQALDLSQVRPCHSQGLPDRNKPILCRSAVNKGLSSKKYLMNTLQSEEITRGGVKLEIHTYALKNLVVEPSVV